MVLDSLPDQCAKDHTSIEMLVSHATYDQAQGSRFQGCANVEATDAITREENPDRRYGSASKLPRPVQTHTSWTTCRMLLWVHLPIQLHAVWPVPFRLAFPLPGARQRHSGTLEPRPIKKGPLDGLLCLFPSNHGDARVGRVPEGDIATARQTRSSPPR